MKPTDRRITLRDERIRELEAELAEQVRRTDIDAERADRAEARIVDSESARRGQMATIAELKEHMEEGWNDGYATGREDALKGGGRESGTTTQSGGNEPSAGRGSVSAANPAARHTCYDCDCDCVDVGRAQSAARARGRGAGSQTGHSTHSKRVERPP